MAHSILARTFGLNEPGKDLQDGYAQLPSLNQPMCHSGKESVRQASPSEMSRIAIVASAAFYHSPSFKYERPDYARFPQDTLADYEAMFSRAAHDEHSLVVVVEDYMEPNEEESVYSELREKCLRPEHAQSGRGVVAVMSAVLPPGSHRRGRYQCKDSILISQDYSTRDKDEEALTTKCAATKEAKDSVLAGRMMIDMVAVHPAYWRRGHGSTLVDWLNRIADEDQTEVAVSAVPMGRKLFEHKGFHVVEQPHIPGYDRHPDSLSGWLGVREPRPEATVRAKALLFTMRKKLKIPVGMTIRSLYIFPKQLRQLVLPWGTEAFGIL